MAPLLSENENTTEVMVKTAESNRGRLDTAAVWPSLLTGMSG